jgi:hypothetical protein
VEAPDERSAIAEAAKQFSITPARRDRISVVELDDRGHWLVISCKVHVEAFSYGRRHCATTA